MIEQKTQVLTEKVKARQAQAAAAIALHLPEMPLEELKSVFGAQLRMLRSPSMDYAHDPFEGQTPIRPSPPPLKWVKKGAKRTLDVAAYTQSR